LASGAGQRGIPPAGRRLAPQRTDRTGGWGRAACTAGAARGEAARGEQCGRSASAVGAAATSAVVTGIVWIIASDGLFAVLTERLGLLTGGRSSPLGELDT